MSVTYWATVFAVLILVLVVPGQVEQHIAPEPVKATERSCP
jgi:hypothetical protein